MSKIAFIFPGQGAQYVGMAKEFYEQVPESKAVFEKAQEVLDFDLKALCFEENEQIHETEYTQAAMLTASVAILEALKAKGVQADITAGLSVGEYAALVASGVLDFADACRVVRKRGIYMQDDVPAGTGAMAAVLGLDSEVIDKICQDIEGSVQVANYNCPGQIVISGEKAAVEQAEIKLKEAGAKRIVPLKVSGPFHSALLKESGDKLGKVLDTVEIKDIQIPYVSNITAEPVTDKTEVKELLMKQISSSVRWEQSVRKMIAEGVDTFIEIGPGKTLTGFMRKIDRTKTSLNIETPEDLEKVVSKLKENQ